MTTNLGYTKGDRNWHVVTEKLAQTAPILRRVSKAACGAILANTNLFMSPTDEDPVCKDCAEGKVSSIHQKQNGRTYQPKHGKDCVSKYVTID